MNEGAKVGDVVLGGIITSLRRRVTKSGKMMAFITLEDLTGVVETVILPETYEKCTAALVDSAIVILRGRAEIDDRWRNEQEGASQMKVMVEGAAALNDPEAVQTLLTAPASTRGRRGQGRSGWPGKSNGNGNGARPAAAPPKENGNVVSVPKEIHIRVRGSHGPQQLRPPQETHQPIPRLRPNPPPHHRRNHRTLPPPHRRLRNCLHRSLLPRRAGDFWGGGGVGGGEDGVRARWGPGRKPRVAHRLLTTRATADNYWNR